MKPGRGNRRAVLLRGEDVRFYLTARRHGQPERERDTAGQGDMDRRTDRAAAPPCGLRFPPRGPSALRPCDTPRDAPANQLLGWASLGGAGLCVSHLRLPGRDAGSPGAITPTSARALSILKAKRLGISMAVSPRRLARCLRFFTFLRFLSSNMNKSDLDALTLRSEVKTKTRAT